MVRVTSLSFLLVVVGACAGAPDATTEQDSLLEEYSASARERAPASIPLGGINVWAYCKSQGYPTVGYRRGYINGSQAAYDNWVCQTGTDQLAPAGPVPVDLDQACRLEYGREDVVARATDPDSAWSWHCYPA